MFINVMCKDCGGVSVIDMSATRDLYNKVEFYFIDDVDVVVEKNINGVLCFRCTECGVVEQLNHEAWFERVRVAVATKLLRDRALLLLTKYRGAGVDEDAGISYCGGCFGYGGDGWCLNDIISQCELGKRKNNES